LCLDGGGYRGIASLLVLKQLLRQVEAAKNRKHKYYPYKHFDIICGTSTGGLIALMLGRCGMDVEGAIQMYKDFGPKVFGSDGGVFLGTVIQGRRFDNAKFKKALESSELAGKRLDVEDEEEGEGEEEGRESDNNCRVSVPNQRLRSLSKPHSEVLCDYCAFHSPNCRRT
jgi:hypothetical protein